MKNITLRPIIFSLIIATSIQVHAKAAKEHLILALQQDQEHRSELNHLNNIGNKKNAELISKLQQAQHNLDLDNQHILDQVIKQLGHWPSSNDVGEGPAKIAMILFKRSDVAKQALYLPQILAAVEAKNTPAIWYADAYDQHLMKQNLPQKYGQLMVQSQNLASASLYPITAIKAVNENRLKLGLEPLKAALGKKNYLLRESQSKDRQPIIQPADEIMKMASLALNCLDQAYPNSVKQVLNSDADALPPRELYPAFFGCFDWHSSVHGHWLLVRAAKLFPNQPQSAEFIDRLDAHFGATQLAAELTYFQQAGRAGFERPYGLAWFLQLYAEIQNWQHPKAQEWITNMQPLKSHIVTQLSTWIPKLAYPIRTGEHSQTAFAFGLSLDYAKSTGDTEFADLLVTHINRLYLNDEKCPTAYEPSGQDFLSPCLAEADLMRRVMPEKRYAKWLKKFLPKIKQGSRWLPVAKVTDRVDGKLAHLDGLNIARAWMLEGIAMNLPSNDKRRSILFKIANKHAKSGLAAVTGEHYSGGHWLGSFATYYLSQRGLDSE